MTKQRFAGVLAVFLVSACVAQAPQPSAAPTTTVATTAVPSTATAAITETVPGAESADLIDPTQFAVTEYDLPSYPHDVAPDPADPNTVWWTAQGGGALGRLNPATGENTLIPLGAGSRPHGVIIGPDGAAWVTDSGLNAIVRVDPATEEVKPFPLPPDIPNINMNTAAFDGNGILWFTGQSGYYGSVDPVSETVTVWEAPRGRGPYGIDATPDGRIFYASLAGNHIAEIDTATGAATPIDPPTPGQGARRVWSDSHGVVWVSEYNAGQVGRYDPASGEWREWKLPGERSLAYAVYVDEQDKVWLSDFAANTMVLFDPVTESFHSFPLSPTGNVRQILGRSGEVWGAESGANKLIVIRQ
ncbi:MAG: SMP-30/gluconolactonase/LRE family protein [Caldilineaceae bacterium]